MNYRNIKKLSAGVVAALALSFAVLTFSGAAHAQDFKSAVEQLPKYKYGETRAFLNPISDAIRDAGGDAEKQKPIIDALVGVLKGESSPDAKRFALRALGPIVKADSVAAIAALAADPEVGDTAVWALDRITDPAAGKALLDALAAAPADKKLTFVAALGWRREAAAAEALAKLITDKDDALAQAASAALARIDAGAAGAALHDARVAAKGAQRDALSNLALRSAEELLAKKDAAGAVKIYEELGAEGEAGHIRAAALTGLVKAEPDKALARVVKALTDKDAQLARVAGAFVRTLPGEDATKAFAGLLAEASPETKIALIQELTDRGDPAARQAVLDAANGADDAGKLAAMKALGKIGNESDAAMLVMAATSLTGDMKRVAQTSLATLPGAGVNANLVTLAQGKNESVASTAIGSLAERRAKETRGDLMKLLDDKDCKVKADVYVALEVLAEESDLPALLKRLDTNVDPDNLAALEKTIVAVSNRNPAEDKRAVAVAEALAKSAATESRTALLQVAGNIPTEESLAAIRKALKSDDGRVRLAAVKAIAAWPTAAPLADLLAIAKTPPSAEERIAAVGGYVRLVREDKDLTSSAQLADYEDVLKVSETAGEKKQIIAGLASIPAKHALELLEGLKADAELAADASSGIVSVARLISGADPAYAREKLVPLATDETPEPIKKPAKAALALLGGFEDFITAWEVSGPYFESGKTARDLFEMQFPPEKGAKDAQWSICPLANNNPESPDLKPWAVDLGGVLGGQERVAFLRTTLDSDKAQDVVLELGTNDGCKVWFNGKEIESIKDGRPIIPGEDKLPVSLKQGKNELMIAVYQHGGPWAACARLATKDGKSAEGVKASVE